MEEVIKYFESLEARLAAAETRIATLEAEVADLKNRPLPEPQVIEKVVEKVVEVEKPVEVIKEVIVEKPVEVPVPPVIETPAPEPVVEATAPEPVTEAPKPVEEKPVEEEAVSPKAAIYGKSVDDIRMAISLGDRFLYQRELFGQNAELMQKTLNALNELHSFDEAIAYISSHFQWDTESSTYQQFLVTLHRRFG